MYICCWILYRGEMWYEQVAEYHKLLSVFTGMADGEMAIRMIKKITK